MIDGGAIAQVGTYFAFAVENLQLAKRAEENATVAAVSPWTLKLQVQSITAERRLRAKRLLAASSLELKSDFHRLDNNQFPRNFLRVNVRIDPLLRKRLPSIEIRSFEQHHRSLRRGQVRAWMSLNPQPPSKFWARSGFAGVKQRLVISSQTHPISLGGCCLRFRPNLVQNRVPLEHFDMRQSPQTFGTNGV